MPRPKFGNPTPGRSVSNATVASVEGKNGGHFSTPSCVVRCLVEMLAPYKGRKYDPASSSGSVFY